MAISSQGEAAGAHSRAAGGSLLIRSEAVIKTPVQNLLAQEEGFWSLLRIHPQLEQSAVWISPSGIGAQQSTGVKGWSCPDPFPLAFGIKGKCGPSFLGVTKLYGIGKGICCESQTQTDRFGTRPTLNGRVP